jgi:hypothetical protein
VFNTVCNDYNLNPKVIVSDRAKTFQRVWESTLEKHKKKLNSPQLAENGPRPRWEFNAARAPWWGGFYERMMTLIKDRMARSFSGRQFDSLASFTEGVSFVQKVINARPLAWASEGKEEPNPITPNMFLFANPPEFKDPYNYGPEDVTFESAKAWQLESSLKKRQRWQNQIWGVFHDMYIAELRKRRETHEMKTDALIKEGQVVLYKPQGLFRENTPQGRLKWKLARVEKLHRSGRDGRVRSVDLTLYNKEKGTTYLLPSQSIQNIAPMEIDLHESELKANKERNNLRRSQRLNGKA